MCSSKYCIVGSAIRIFTPSRTTGAPPSTRSYPAMRWSERNCDQCVDNLQNYCPKLTLTYNRIQPDDTVTYGGYSDVMVVDGDFVIRWPEDFPMDKGAPLLCAGITTYSQMKYYGLDKPGLHIGVVGLGGLGHVAAKFAKAFGSKVTVISTVGKKKEAMESFSADGFVISRELQEMQAGSRTLQGIIDTVSAVHALAPLLSLLKPHGKLIVVGAPEKRLELSAFSITLARKTVAGSIIGGLKETQDMIDFAGKHNIVCDVEIIPIDYVKTCKADVKYRFVIDV
ncbi:8-hydroxygeraniol dehydrogenase [Sesamum angolense]|uniref:8-hydroxygeraniol dehydrogenase n=1 Tax=Sesamum angolense TaxID=2727404 RepID=A0AAE1WZ81_9LAMI|nr:8-hydroxygeraniol dehydrogenase [Sesamum angolense]